MSLSADERLRVAHALDALGIQFIEAGFPSSNPKEEALEHAYTSTPFLVDNRKPELSAIKVTYPTAQGRAQDSFSAVSELAYSVDGGEDRKSVV